MTAFCNFFSTPRISAQVESLGLVSISLSRYRLRDRERKVSVSFEALSLLAGYFNERILMNNIVIHIVSTLLPKEYFYLSLDTQAPTFCSFYKLMLLLSLSPGSIISDTKLLFTHISRAQGIAFSNVQPATRTYMPYAPILASNTSEQRLYCYMHKTTSAKERQGHRQCENKTKST